MHRQHEKVIRVRSVLISSDIGTRGFPFCSPSFNHLLFILDIMAQKIDMGMQLFRLICYKSRYVVFFKPDDNVESCHSEWHRGGYSVRVLTVFFSLFSDYYFLVMSLCISNSSLFSCSNIHLFFLGGGGALT